jgi:acyl dehydratase
MSNVTDRKQRYYEDVTIGEELPSLSFPLSIYRLVVEAGANRDFNAIHHNTDYARSTGAPDMYANTIFLQGMWERTVRDFIGLDGTIRALKGFRMKIFNTVGDTVVVKGRVESMWEDGDVGVLEIGMWSECSKGVSVGPGSMIVTVPRRNR